MQNYPTALTNQLGLPLPEESYLAFQEYQLYAIQSLGRTKADFAQLLKEFKGLSPDEQQALIYYTEPSVGGAKTFDALASVADLGAC